MHVDPIYVGLIYMGLTLNVSWCRIDVGITHFFYINACMFDVFLSLKWKK